MHTRGMIAFFVVSLLLIVGVFSFGVWWGNDRLYSARQFARNYLNALVAHDTQYLAQMSGIGLPSEHTELLTDGQALGTLSNPRVTEVTDGNQFTLVRYKIDSVHKTLKGSIVLQRQPDTMGLFRSWKFAEPPLGSLRLRVLGATSAYVNDAETTTSSTPYPVFVPGVYQVQHNSAVLTSDKKTVIITKSSDEPAYATVTAHPSATFVKLVNGQVQQYLNTCATQHVLFPEHCPFGVAIDSPIVGDPQWTISAMPTVSLLRYRAGRWPIQEATGRATVTGEQTNRATGKTSKFTKTVDFTITLAVKIVQNKLYLVPDTATNS